VPEAIKIAFVHAHLDHWKAADSEDHPYEENHSGAQARLRWRDDVMLLEVNGENNAEVWESIKKYLFAIRYRV
jgi:hypothetical protein